MGGALQGGHAGPGQHTGPLHGGGARPQGARAAVASARRAVGVLGARKGARRLQGVAADAGGASGAGCDMSSLPDGSGPQTSGACPRPSWARPAPATAQQARPGAWLSLAVTARGCSHRPGAADAGPAAAAAATVLHVGHQAAGALQADLPPSVKQYAEAILARLLVADLDLALALLLPRLRSFVHRHARSLLPGLPGPLLAQSALCCCTCFPCGRFLAGLHPRLGGSLRIVHAGLISGPWRAGGTACRHACWWQGMSRWPARPSGGGRWPCRWSQRCCHGRPRTPIP